MRSTRNTLRPHLLAFAIAAVGLSSIHCEDDFEDLSSDHCRFHPEDCDGGAGALCDDDHDCADQLFCCEEDANCGGGMCTASCDDDYDCPYDMLCEHHMCFYACDRDEDCAEEMKCEHKNTVCEWP